jgi:hypothetical protein
MQTRAQKVVRRRPAEAGGVAGALALLVARVAGVTDPNIIVALATVFGFTPCGLTWLKDFIEGTNPSAQTVGEGGRA